MKNLPKIQVSLKTKEMTTLEFISAVQSVKTTGDPDAGNPPVADATLYAAAGILQTIHNNRNTKPPISTADEEIVQRNLLERLYNKVGMYVQGVAKDVAVTTGDAASGNAVVNRVGYKLKKRNTGKKTDFGVMNAGPNFVQLHVKKAKKGVEAHLWRFAITTEKGVAPAKTILITICTIECDVIIRGIASGSILAVQHASVIPVRHTKKLSGSNPENGKKVSLIAQNEAKHPVFNMASPDPYTWTDFLYVGIQ